MSDRETRALERAAALGDPEARAKLERAKLREGTGTLPSLEPYDGGPPPVGMGATFGYGSDCYPYTVVDVSPSGKTIWLARDDYQIVSGSFQGGDARHEYRPDPESQGDPRTWRKATWRTVRGQAGYFVGPGRSAVRVSLGRRMFYQDPHF